MVVTVKVPAVPTTNVAEFPLVIAAGSFTVCVSIPLLATKLASPLYSAVMV